MKVESPRLSNWLDLKGKGEGRVKVTSRLGKWEPRWMLISRTNSEGKRWGEGLWGKGPPFGGQFKTLWAWSAGGTSKWRCPFVDSCRCGSGVQKRNQGWGWMNLNHLYRSASWSGGNEWMGFWRGKAGQGKARQWDRGGRDGFKRESPESEGTHLKRVDRAWGAFSAQIYSHTHSHHYTSIYPYSDTFLHTLTLAVHICRSPILGRCKFPIPGPTVSQVGNEEGGRGFFWGDVLPDFVSQHSGS